VAGEDPRFAIVIVIGQDRAGAALALIFPPTPNLGARTRLILLRSRDDPDGGPHRLSIGLTGPAFVGEDRSAGLPHVRAS